MMWQFVMNYNFHQDELNKNLFCIESYDLGGLTYVVDKGTGKIFVGGKELLNWMSKLYGYELPPEFKYEEIEDEFRIYLPEGGSLEGVFFTVPKRVYRRYKWTIEDNFKK